MFNLFEIGNPQWVALVMGLPPDCRDIHFDQRMLAPYVGAYGWKSYLALTDTMDGYIIQPLLINKENEIRHPYNFGGPIGSNNLLNSKEHVESLNEWAEDHDIRSQHYTLVPNLTQDQLRLLSSSNINPVFRKNSVLVDLNNQKIRGTTRRLANKAQGEGVTVKQYDYTYLKYFIDIYTSTLERRNAKEHWYFTPKWFEVFCRLVKPCLMLANYQGKFEAGCLIAYSQQYPVAYYHFAGSYNTYPTLGINHMMVLAACEFVKSINMSKLYLGGGVTDSEDDSLMIFKSGFSKLRLPVYGYNMEYGDAKPTGNSNNQRRLLEDMYKLN